MMRLPNTRLLAALCLGLSWIASTAPAADEPFRPEAGKFPPCLLYTS